MNQHLKYLLCTFITLSIISCKKEQDTNSKTTINTSRIISLNSAVTEIICALGYQNNISGVDVTSTYPENIKTTAKDLGHTSRINVESIMELKPTLVIGTDTDISDDLEAKLEAAGVTVKKLTQDFSVDGTKTLIKQVAGVFGSDDYKKLQDDIDKGLAEVQPLRPAPKVLFIYARGANMMMVSGAGTAEDKVIKLAGGQNAVTGFEDFKPLTPEALVQNNPDYILMYTSGLESVGSVEGILKIPGVDKTNAGKNRKIITLDGGLIHAFGPRIGEAAAQLNALISK